MSNKIKLISTLISFGVALAVSPAIADTPKKGGTLTVAVETDVRGFDVVKGGVLGISGGTVANTIMEPLIDRDPETGEYRPRLALSWSSSDDLLAWTVKLRKGVKFHDGSEFTAEDAADHINRILDPKNKARTRAFITPIKGATVVDRYTVRYELKHPWVPFLGILASTQFAGLIPAQEATKSGTQNRHPIGTGPFIFKSWSGGDRIVVERNPNYWNKGSINLDRIVFRILPDTQARFASLKSGEVDVIWTDRGASIRAAKNDPNLVTIQRDGSGSGLVLFNTSKPPLDDKRVRQALSHAYNQDAVLKILWQNTRPFARHPLGPQSKCDAGYLEYNPEKAKRLLAEYGKPVRLERLHSTTPRGRDMGEIMQHLFKEVGVELKLVPVDQNTLIKRVFKNDFMISGWRIVDSTFVGVQLFALSNPKGRYNLSRYDDDEIAKVARALKTAKTLDERNKLNCDLVRMTNDSGHMKFNSGVRYHTLTRKNVRDVTIGSLGRVTVSEAWKE